MKVPILAALTAAILAAAPSLQAQEPASGYAAAAAAVRQGRFTAAVPILQRILAREPHDLKARNLLGIALMSSGRRAEAAAQFQKVLDRDPRFHPALKNLALCELELGRRKEARAHLEQALELVPQDAVVHFQLGRIHFGEGRYTEAAARFQSARAGFPDRYQAGFNLVLAHVRAGDHRAAIRAGEQLTGEGHRTAELYNLLAQAYAQAGEIQRAYDALRAATQIEPGEESNYLDLMRLCLEHQNWELSLEIAEVGLARIPGAYRIRLQRGAVYALQGRPEEAEREFAAAARAEPGANLPHVALALLRMEVGRTLEAIEGLRGRRAVSPDDPLVNWILGEALVQEGVSPGTAEEKEAVRVLAASVRGNPKSAPPRALLGKLAARRGDTASAAAHFEAALKLEPGDAATAYQLALLYQKTGRTERAEKLFAKVGEARAEDPAREAGRNLVRILREEPR